MMKISNGLLDRVVLASRIAPRVSGTIVGANPCRRSKARLDEIPVYRKCAPASLQHDGWEALARAVEMKPAAADIDKPARRRIAERLTLLSEHSTRTVTHADNGNSDSTG